jgi:hypothetical protein
MFAQSPINKSFKILRNESSIWRTSGLMVSDLVTHYMLAFFEFLSAITTLIFMARMAEPLTQVCHEMGSILLHAVTAEQVRPKKLDRFSVLKIFCLSLKRPRFYSF